MDFLLNSAGDIDESFTLTTTAQELIKQKVLITLRTNLEEWKFNLDFGVPWVTSEFNKRQVYQKGHKSFSDAIIRETLLSVEGVESVSELSSTINAKTREYILKFKLKIYDGSLVEFSETLEV